jgi:hypothetical protein
MSTISGSYIPAGIQSQDGGRPLYLGHSKVPRVATALHRRRPQRALEVLQLGGVYVHCGEPMHAADSGLRSLDAPLTTEQIHPVPNGALEVYLCTRVLRCSCGFQMDAPE